MTSQVSTPKSHVGRRVNGRNVASAENVRGSALAAAAPHHRASVVPPFPTHITRTTQWSARPQCRQQNCVRSRSLCRVQAVGMSAPSRPVIFGGISDLMATQK